MTPVLKREMLDLCQYMLRWNADHDSQVTAHEIESMRGAAREMLRLLLPQQERVGAEESTIEGKDGRHIEDRIVLLDGNGNAMNMWVTCSCGAEMTLDLATSWREKTEVVCKGCGNRLTVTVSLGGQA